MGWGLLTLACPMANQNTQLKHIKKPTHPLKKTGFVSPFFERGTQQTPKGKNTHLQRGLLFLAPDGPR